MYVWLREQTTWTLTDENCSVLSVCKLSHILALSKELHLRLYGDILRSLLRATVFIFFSICSFHMEFAEAEGPKRIEVFLESQTLRAMEGDTIIYEFDVVTGQAGKETEVGGYKVLRKHEQYVSKTYGSEMPYTMFFSQDGKAIHGTTVATLRSYLQTYLTSSLGSKGCVGLTDDNAKALFEWAPVGTQIRVKGE